MRSAANSPEVFHEQRFLARERRRIVQVAEAQRLIPILLHVRLARAQQLGVGPVQRDFDVAGGQLTRGMRATNVVPVAMRGEDPLDVLEAQALGVERRLDDRAGRGGDARVNQRRLGRVDVIHVDDAARCPEWTGDRHDARLGWHGLIR